MEQQLPVDHRRRAPLERLPSNEEWVAWGSVDPLYAVATIPGRAASDANRWSDAEFVAQGAADWRLFREQWRQYGFPRATVVEIGCGAGRLTAHLPADFESVYALDVSPAMIQHARRLAPSNVEFRVTNGLEIPLDGSSADGVFSAHVFQHLSTVDAAATYFGEMYRVLAPSGTIMIHLPILAWPWGSLVGVHKAVHRARATLDRCRVATHRLAYRLRLAKTPPMLVIWYDVDWLHKTLADLGFEAVELRVLFRHSQMAVQHPFLFARKPSVTAAAGNR